MEKKASPVASNSVTQLPIPFGDINNRRFLTAVLAGVLGGAGVSAAANLLRNYRELRSKKPEDTDEDTIVLTLPKAASDGYTAMHDAKPGEAKVTANGSRQLRDAGRYGQKLSPKKPEKDEVKCAAGNPGPNSVGTVVANAIGLTAGGLLSYEVVSRMFDTLQERRLKRKLRAAQQAYVDAMSGASKRAEVVMSVIGPAERVLSKDSMNKVAGWSDIFPESVTNTVRYPAAAYILALLAGTGATAYVTKKVMDREFPEEKLKKDINRPTRIVFRTEGGKPSLVEGEKGEEKAASAETCAALTVMLPIYMDVVEGRPNRTLAEPYVKIAEAAGTDPAGLMKMAAEDAKSVAGIVLKDPKAVWAILRGTDFGFNYSKLNAARALRGARPETYRRAVDAAIDAHFAGGPNDGMFRKAWNGVAKGATKAFAGLGGRDMLVEHALKSASVSDMFSLDSLRGLGDKQDDDVTSPEPVDTAAVVSRAKHKLKGRRSVTVEAGDPQAARYIKANKAAIKRLLARLNAQGAI